MVNLILLFTMYFYWLAPSICNYKGKTFKTYVILIGLDIKRQKNRGAQNTGSIRGTIKVLKINELVHS